MTVLVALLVYIIPVTSVFSKILFDNAGKILVQVTKTFQQHILASVEETGSILLNAAGIAVE